MTHHRIKIIYSDYISFMYKLSFFWMGFLDSSVVVQLVKNQPAMWETWVQSLDREDTMEKGKAAHSIILAWRIPWSI